MCEQEGFAESNSDGSLTGYAIDYLAQLGSDAGYNIDVLLIDKGLRPEEVIPSECDLILTCEDLKSYSGYSISKAAVFGKIMSSMWKRMQIYILKNLRSSMA